MGGTCQGSATLDQCQPACDGRKALRHEYLGDVDGVPTMLGTKGPAAVVNTGRCCCPASSAVLKKLGPRQCHQGCGVGVAAISAFGIVSRKARDDSHKEAPIVCGDSCLVELSETNVTRNDDICNLPLGQICYNVILSLLGIVPNSSKYGLEPTIYMQKYLRQIDNNKIREEEAFMR